MDTNRQYLFEQIRSASGGRLSRKGSSYECHIHCPSCNAAPPAGNGNYHFSFSAEKGGYCFVCYEAVSLLQLAEKYGIGSQKPFTLEPLAVPQEERYEVEWQRPGFLATYTASIREVVWAWSAYKPISLPTIRRYGLTYGRMPAVLYPDRRLNNKVYACRDNRLIVPVFNGGTLTAVRGRQIRCSDECGVKGAKWLTAKDGTSSLYNIDAVMEGDLAIVAENIIDGLLAQDYLSDGCTGLAGTAGAQSWRGSWSVALLLKRPRAIILWLDNDLSGWPGQSMVEEFMRQWRIEHPQMKKAPRPAGPRIAMSLHSELRRLKACGLLPASYQPTISHYDWQAGTPHKHDLGSFILDGAAPERFWQRALDVRAA